MVFGWLLLGLICLSQEIEKDRVYRANLRNYTIGKHRENIGHYREYSATGKPACAHPALGYRMCPLYCHDLRVPRSTPVVRTDSLGPTGYNCFPRIGTGGNILSRRPCEATTLSPALLGVAGASLSLLGPSMEEYWVRISRKLWPLTPKIDRVTWRFLNFDM